MSADPFSQWIDVPDDHRPALPPVDEEICGFQLKDFSSLGFASHSHIQTYEPNAGLLLGSDSFQFQNFTIGGDAFDAIALSSGIPDRAVQYGFFQTCDSDATPNHSYASLFPPALSPDSSPTSVASSTPWLKTPDIYPSPFKAANFTPVDTAWELPEQKELCPSAHFVDQSGNSLEDIPSQVQDLMPEDIACTPQFIPDAPLPLPRAPVATPYGSSGPGTPTSLSNTQSLMTSQPSAPASSLCSTSLHTSQPFSTFSPVALQQTSLPTFRPSSASLSPLSTLTLLSQSPSVSPDLSPLVSCSPLLPADSGDERVDPTESASTATTFGGATTTKFGRICSARILDNDAPPWRVPKRSKAMILDDEEWSPGSERLKRPRTSASPAKQIASNATDGDSSNYEASQGSEGPDATHTSCEICGQGFTRTSDYMRHIENSASHPETRKVWPCPHCDRVLGRKDALVRHIRTIHNEPPAFIPDGIPGNQLPEGQRERLVQRLGQRKVPLRKKDKRAPY